MRLPRAWNSDRYCVRSTHHNELAQKTPALITANLSTLAQRSICRLLSSLASFSILLGIDLGLLSSLLGLGVSRLGISCAIGFSTVIVGLRTRRRLPCALRRPVLRAACCIVSVPSLLGPSSSFGGSASLASSTLPQSAANSLRVRLTRLMPASVPQKPTASRFSRSTTRRSRKVAAVGTP